MAENRKFRSLVLALLLAAGPAAPTCAQILGGGLPGLPGGGTVLGGLPGGLADTPRVRAPDGVGGRALAPIERIADELTAAPLSDLRRLTADRLLRRHADVVEADDNGRPVVRGEVLATGLAPEAVTRLRQAGFNPRADDELGGLGLRAFVLHAPRGLSAVEAIQKLRSLDPAGQYDFNHVYQEGGAVEASAAGRQGAGSGDGRGLRIGLIDGGVDRSAPALSQAHLIQQAFGPRGGGLSAHGTAVASLIAGEARRFHGAAPGAALYVADVYGPSPAGGSAEGVARALAWLDRSGTPVINISLVGPPNLLLKAAVEAMLARGHLIVAAVGNDGPAAPPLYPAAYPGVVAVTGVDARRQVLPEAGRGTHVDFAAPGADMAAARVGGGFVTVRGTSFAAPIVAGQLARTLASEGPAGAVAALGRAAADLGAPGPDPVYGRGLVGADLRADPAGVGAIKASQ